MKHTVLALAMLLFCTLACNTNSSQPTPPTPLASPASSASPADPILTAKPTTEYYNVVNDEPPQEQNGPVPTYLEQPNSPDYPPASFNICQELTKLANSNKMRITSTGLRYATEKEGTGKCCDGADSTTVTIAYTTMCADATPVDARDHNIREEKRSFAIGLDTNLAAGFHEIVKGMREGETRLVAMPVNQAIVEGNRPFSRTRDFVYVRLTLESTLTNEESQ